MSQRVRVRVKFWDEEKKAFVTALITCIVTSLMVRISFTFGKERNAMNYTAVTETIGSRYFSRRRKNAFVTAVKRRKILARVSFWKVVSNRVRVCVTLWEEEKNAFVTAFYCIVTDGTDQLHFWKRKKRFELHSGFKYSVTQSVGLCTFRGEEKNAFVTAVKRRKILTRVSLWKVVSNRVRVRVTFSEEEKIALVTVVNMSTFESPF